MYKRLTRYRIRVKFASPSYLGLGIILIIILPTIYVCHTPYTHGTRIARLLGVRNYLNNYFNIYIRLSHFRIRMELVSPTYLGLGII